MVDSPGDGPAPAGRGGAAPLVLELRRPVAGARTDGLPVRGQNSGRVSTAYAGRVGLRRIR